MSFGKKNTGSGNEIPLSTMAMPVQAAVVAPVSPPAENTPAIVGKAVQPQIESESKVQALSSGDLIKAMKEAEQSATTMIRYNDQRLITDDFRKAKIEIIESFLDKTDLNSMEKLPMEQRRQKVEQTSDTLIKTVSMPLNAAQQEQLKKEVMDELLGLGPLEILMRDPDVSDIMVNSHRTIYIEKKGKLALSDITFTSEKHLLSIIQRIVSGVGRRVDETSPMVDARMPDGSRFNALIPPIALDGSLVSIRKFKKNKMPLTDYLKYGSMSEQMCRFLEIAGHIRLNIIISGGTGSGKTTMLNALSGHIDDGERVITIEDAAELMLHQPHVLRLETRPPNMEGTGEINQRMLMKNALRMRPDRIILGEIRGGEVLDVLAAMNTGHEGSMATIHANNPRDCLSRIENLVGLAGLSIPLSAMRMQIASAVNLIVQVSRMRDGKRRVTHIEEIVGMEGDMITTQTLFYYKLKSIDEKGNMVGDYVFSNVRPRMYEKSIYFGRDKELEALLGFNNRAAFS